MATCTCTRDLFICTDTMQIVEKNVYSKRGLWLSLVLYSLKAWNVLFQKISVLPPQRVFWIEPPSPLEIPVRLILSFKTFGLKDLPPPRNFPWPSVVGVWMFSRTTQCVPVNRKEKLSITFLHLMPTMPSHGRQQGLPDFSSVASHIFDGHAQFQSH